MNIYIAWAWLACLGLAACSLNPLIVSESASIQAPIDVPINELTPRLEAMWDTLDQGEAPPDILPVLWRAAYSPLFPTEWPPTPSTVWVRYAYAYGQDVNLADGARVARPWARAELRGGSSTAAIVPLSPKLEPFEIQGVSPLDAETSALFDKGEQVSTYCLGLQALPNLNTSEAATMRTFYQAWLNYHGAIASVIKPSHAVFFEWIESQ
jgi:hypothetical protein